MCVHRPHTCEATLPSPGAWVLSPQLPVKTLSYLQAFVLLGLSLKHPPPGTGLREQDLRTLHLAVGAYTALQLKTPAPKWGQAHGSGGGGVAGGVLVGCRLWGRTELDTTEVI